MPELDTAAALCEALNQPLSQELGTAVVCVDVSPQMIRWDLEARDVVTGKVMRRFGHTRTVCEHIAKLMAEVGKEFRPALEAALAQLGVRSYWVTLGARSLPNSKVERRALAALLAERIRKNLLMGVTLVEDPIDCILAGRAPYNDAITKHTIAA